MHHNLSLASFLLVALGWCHLLAASMPHVSLDCQPGEDDPMLAESGAWNWCQDPKAVIHIGEHRRTYAGWVDDRGQVFVGYHDHDTQRVDAIAVHDSLQKDDHVNRALLISAVGKIMAPTAGSGHHMHRRRST